MIISTKCNCCAAEDICKYKEVYTSAVDQITQTAITTGDKSVCFLKNCKFLEVSIRCPFMRRADNG